MQNKPSEKQSSCEKSSERSAPKAEQKSTKHSHHSSPHGNSKNETSNKNSTECSPQTYAELNKYKSPSKQVKGNALKLKQYVESKNIFSQSLRLWVDGIVVFTHGNVILRCDNPTVPVFKVDQLCNYIRNKESRIKFSSQELEKVAKILLRQA